MADYRVNIRYNQQNLGSAVNTFVFRESIGTPSDAQLLAAATAWMERIYDPLRPFMDSGCVFASGQVVEVNNLNETVRVVGGITPDISGTASGDQLALVTAASAFARTFEPKVRGSKRFPGVVETQQADGLLANPIVAALVEAVIEWLANFVIAGLAEGFPGVMSTTVLDFVEFAGTAVVTNIPGTQVTRKPLRGQ